MIARFSVKEGIQRKEITNLGLPEILLDTSGVNFLRTPSNIEGLKGLPVSSTGMSFFFKVMPFGSRIDTKSTNAASVG